MKLLQCPLSSAVCIVTQIWGLGLCFLVYLKAALAYGISLLQGTPLSMDIQVAMSAGVRVLRSCTLGCAV
jgi:membrane protein implicated in regulation of membrane protease activity